MSAPTTMPSLGFLTNKYSSSFFCHTIIFEDTAAQMVTLNRLLSDPEPLSNSGESRNWPASMLWRKATSVRTLQRPESRRPRLSVLETPDTA